MTDDKRRFFRAVLHEEGKAALWSGMQYGDSFKKHDDDPNITITIGDGTIASAAITIPYGVLVHLVTGVTEAKAKRDTPAIIMPDKKIVLN